MTDEIKALSMDSAPKDNTLVRLLVDYSGEGDHPLEDAEQAWTIGFNNFEDSEIDEWQFAGWSWSQDCFCEGEGRVIGWAPFHQDDRLHDAAAPMADGGDTPMTAAEEVLAWLLVDKIGVPDDVSYSPDQAQKIIADRLAQIPSPQTNVEPSTAFAEWLNSGPDIAKTEGIEVEIVAITAEGGTLKLTSAGFPDAPAPQDQMTGDRDA